MNNVGFQLKRWLIISPFSLAFISLPFTGLAIDVKDVAKLSPASQELRQDSHLPWVPLVGGGVLLGGGLVLAIAKRCCDLRFAATHDAKRRQRRGVVKPSGYTSQVSSSHCYSQPHNHVHSGSRHVDVDVDVDVDIDVDSDDGDNSDRTDWSNQLDSCESSNDDSDSSWNSDSHDSSWSSDSSDSCSSWNSDSHDSSWSSDSSSSGSSYDSSSSSSDYGGGSSGGGGADGSW